MADTPPIPGVSKIYHYWTDFTPNNTQNFKMHSFTSAKPGYWKFRTNIDPGFFHTKLEPKWQRRFLFKMYELYVLKGMT
jgi:hypothetical protein